MGGENEKCGLSATDGDGQRLERKWYDKDEKESLAFYVHDICDDVLPADDTDELLLFNDGNPSEGMFHEVCAELLERFIDIQGNNIGCHEVFDLCGSCAGIVCLVMYAKCQSEDVFFGDDAYHAVFLIDDWQAGEAMRDKCLYRFEDRRTPLDGYDMGLHNVSYLCYGFSSNHIVCYLPAPDGAKKVIKSTCMYLGFSLSPRPGHKNAVLK